MKTYDYKALAQKVNNYWQSEMPESGICSWERSAYMLGNLAAYDLTGNEKFLSYALKWAQDNDWRFYDSADYYTTNADSILCGESYLRLMELFPGKGTDEHMLRTMENILNDEKNDYWWWIDTIYMALPYFHIMGVRYGDVRYFEKAHRLFVNTRTERGLYDEDEHLWYRDDRFTPDKMLTKEGKKIFWGRGNGWVFAGLARTLEVIDEKCPYYEEYKKVFCDMAKRIKSFLRPDGGFTTGLLNPEDYPLSETSATSLFTLGFLIGVRIGLLDESYLDTALCGFKWLTQNALLESGRIGFVQGISWSPEKNWENYDFETKKMSTKDYAVGTYLLILKEVHDCSQRKRVDKNA